MPQYPYDPSDPFAIKNHTLAAYTSYADYLAYADVASKQSWPPYAAYASKLASITANPTI
jgi:hypothetical protein